MIKIKSMEEFKTKLDQSKIIIVVFTTTWCPDCHYIESFMDSVIDNFSSKASTFNIDIEEIPEIKKQYKINGIPSFVAFKDGIEINRFVNRSRKSKDEIEKFFEKSIKQH